MYSSERTTLLDRLASYAFLGPVVNRELSALISHTEQKSTLDHISELFDELDSMKNQWFLEYLQDFSARLSREEKRFLSAQAAKEKKASEGVAADLLNQIS